MPFNVGYNLNCVRLHDDCYNGKLEEVYKNLDNYNVKMDFWGTRRLVGINGTEKPIDLETVAIRALKAGYCDKPPIKDFEGEYLSAAELELKSKICTQLSKFYMTADSLIGDLNPISNLFFLLKERFNPITRLIDYIDSLRGIENFSVRQQVINYNLNRTV